MFFIVLDFRQSLLIFYRLAARRPENLSPKGFLFGLSIPLKIKKQKIAVATFYFSGGDEGDRTPYLLNAIQALSQVSYTPK